MKDEQVGEDGRLVCDTCRGLELKPTRPALRWTGTPRTQYGAEKRIKKEDTKEEPTPRPSTALIAIEGGLESSTPTISERFTSSTLVHPTDDGAGGIQQPT